MTLLKLILVTSLFCNGLYEATGNKRIFERPRDWMELYLPKWVFSPIIGCIYCMSSVWSIVGVVIYSLLYQFDINLVYLLPVMICCVCALNGVIYNLIN
jgi:hypothetical protein